MFVYSALIVPVRPATSSFRRSSGGSSLDDRSHGLYEPLGICAGFRRSVPHKTRVFASGQLGSHLLNHFVGAVVDVTGCVTEHGDSGSKQTIHTPSVGGEAVAMSSSVVLDA